MVEHFPTQCSVGPLVSGPDGNVWFTCFESFFHAYDGPLGQSLIGRITPQGEVAGFDDGIEPGDELGALEVAPDGTLWFAIDPVSSDARGAIGRITPSGQITVFQDGLGPAHQPRTLLVGPDGDIWFTYAEWDHKRAGIGRITPQGQISEFAANVRFYARSDGHELIAAADGNLWFLPAGSGTVARITPSGQVTEFTSPNSGRIPTNIASGPEGNVWFAAQVVTGLSGIAGQTIGRISPAGELTEFNTGFASGRTIVDIVSGPDGNLWFASQPVGGRGFSGQGGAIGRITPSGQITEFTNCLDYRLPTSGPLSLTPGPDGNLWFTSLTSTVHDLSEAPTIGRITPSGKITQFRAGLGAEPRSIIAGPDGRVWFSSGLGRVERITPTTAPINTFGLKRPKRTNAYGIALLGVQVPGPGTLRLGQVALLPHERLRGKVATNIAGSCGETFLTIQTRGRAKARLLKKGSIREKLKVTFTPTGGTPYTRVLGLTLTGPKRHHLGRHR